MVRHYTGDAIPRETLERIAATVRRAPSGGFSQGQRLIVVDDPALLRQFASSDAERPEGTEPWFGTAGAQNFVLARENDHHERFNQPGKPQPGRRGGKQGAGPLLARRP